MADEKDWTYRGHRIDGWTAQTWIRDRLKVDIPHAATNEIYRYCRIGPDAYRDQADSRLKRQVKVWMAKFVLQLKPLRGVA